ncbi:MAG: carboxypeptidase regulatory-like domain-containing protein [Bacteroidota bacterium]
MKMKYSAIGSLLIVLVATMIISSCKSSEAQGNQGIKGTVLWYEGNLMPSPQQDPPEGKPVVREMFIYKLTNIGDTKQNEQFFSDIKTELVKTVTTDKNGKFKVDLPEGTYSIFSKEENGLFANYFDGNNSIAPVQVVSNQYSEIKFRIDYKAAY